MPADHQIEHSHRDEFVLAPESIPSTVFCDPGSLQQSNAAHTPDPLGPDPESSVEVFADLGLSSSEIAQYFGVPEGRITRLRKVLGRKAMPC